MDYIGFGWFMVFVVILGAWWDEFGFSIRIT